jgi:hypothetical protein
MKKFLIFLLTLSFVASAFALDLGEGLTLTGEVKSGIGVFSADDGEGDTDDTKIKFYNNDAGKDFRGRLTFLYDADWGGGKIRLHSEGGSSAPVSVPYGYGWANFLEKKIVLYGGWIGDDLWGLGKLSQNVFDTSFDGVTGARIAFNNLVDGLSFGVAFPLLNSPQDIGDAFASTIIGALYKSEFFSIAADLKLNPEVDAVAGGQKKDMFVDVLLGIEVNPFAGFTAVVDTRIDTRKAENHDGTSGYVRIGPKFVYSGVDKLTAHLKGDIGIQLDDDDPKTGHKGTYAWADGGAAGGGVARENDWDAALGLELGASYAVTETIKPYLNIGSDNLLWLTGQEEDGATRHSDGNGLYLKPGVVFTISPTASIEIFDKINKIGAVQNEVVVGGTTKKCGPITNQFQIDFNWSF